MNNDRKGVKTFAFMDLETSGLNSVYFWKPRITEISIYACLRKDILNIKDNKVEIPRTTKKLVLFFNPAVIINPDASLLSGLYNDMLEDENNFDSNAGQLIINFLKYLPQPVCLVAHNGLGFDFPILKKSFERINVNLPERILCIDSYLAIKDIDKVQKFDIIVDYEAIQELNTNNNNEEKKRNRDESVTGKSLQVECLSPEKKINWQKINETTPKRKINRKLYIGKKSKTFHTLENAPKARKELFSFTRKMSDSDKSLSYHSNGKGYYKQSSIYKRIFDESPDVIHHAEADVTALQKILLSYGEKFVEYADENAIEFAEISTKGF